MLEERTIYLINADLDGELGAEEKAELDAMLESSSEAREMRAELLRLNNLMDSLPEVSPPPGLSEKIVDQLIPPRRARFPFPEWLSSFQPAPAGLAFAAGLLLTIAYYEMSPRSDSGADTARMVGTMVAGQADTRGLLEKDIHLRGDGFSGTVSLTQQSGLYVLSFDLDSRESTRLEIGLDRTGLAFGGFAEIEGVSDRVFDAVAISGGTLRVVNEGQLRFAVFLRETGPRQSVHPGEISIDFSPVADRNGSSANGTL